MAPKSSNIMLTQPEPSHSVPPTSVRDTLALQLDEGDLDGVEVDDTDLNALRQQVTLQESQAQSNIQMDDVKIASQVPKYQRLGAGMPQGLKQDIRRHTCDFVLEVLRNFPYGNILHLKQFNIYNIIILFTEYT